MLAVVKEKPEPGVVIKQVPVPEPQKDEVLIKVLHASICGTDIGIHNWNAWAANHITPPTIIGHEVAGKIVSINADNPLGLKIGDFVSSETHIFDGTCAQCKQGNRHICENMDLYGIGRDGGFAEYATIPIRTTWKNNPSMPFEQMSAQEPLGNAVHVVSKADVRGKKVLVLGLGPTGLCAGMVAKAYGAEEVVGLDIADYRLRLGEKVGFDRVMNLLPEKEYGVFDVVLEMSGSAAAIAVGFEAIRIAGIFVYFGIPKEPVPMDIGKYFINKELRMTSVFGRHIWETWYETTKLLQEEKVDLSEIITHRFALRDFEKAMAIMKSGTCGKIVLTP